MQWAASTDESRRVVSGGPLSGKVRTPPSAPAQMLGTRPKLPIALPNGGASRVRLRIGMGVNLVDCNCNLHPTVVTIIQHNQRL